jgi:hypothetical protein
MFNPLTAFVFAEEIAPKEQSNGDAYEPTLTAATKNLGDKVEIGKRAAAGARLIIARHSAKGFSLAVGLELCGCSPDPSRECSSMFLTMDGAPTRLSGID